MGGLVLGFVFLALNEKSIGNRRRFRACVGCAVLTFAIIIAGTVMGLERYYPHALILSLGILQLANAQVKHVQTRTPSDFKSSRTPLLVGFAMLILLSVLMYISL